MVPAFERHRSFLLLSLRSFLDYSTSEAVTALLPSKLPDFRQFRQSEAPLRVRASLILESNHKQLSQPVAGYGWPDLFRFLTIFIDRGNRGHTRTFPARFRISFEPRNRF